MPQKPTPGLFVVFEGGEGSGKSSTLRLVAKELHSRGQPITLTREPGGSRLGLALRKLIFAHNMAPLTELLLYMSARSEHLVQTVVPALKKGEIVLCDRYYFSSVAYQGLARGLGKKLVYELHQQCFATPRPDLTVFLDIRPELGLSRAADPNRFEREPLEFHKKVRTCFQSLYRSLPPGNRLKLNTEKKNPQEICDLVVSAIEAKAKRYKRSRQQ